MAWLAVSSVLAQEPSIASFNIFFPKEGFSENYQKHINWHRQNKDPWTWYGWQILTGPRQGYVFEGTTGHRWADFDHRLKPEEDRADADRTVMPYIAPSLTDHVSWVTTYWQELATYSNHPKHRSDDAYQLVYNVRVIPGMEEAFTKWLDRWVKNAKKRDLAFLTYRCINGGELPLYMIWIAADKFEAMEKSTAFYDDHAGEMVACVRSVESELMRYRPEWSYFPD